MPYATSLQFHTMRERIDAIPSLAAWIPKKKGHLTMSFFLWLRGGDFSLPTPRNSRLGRSHARARYSFSRPISHSLYPPPAAVVLNAPDLRVIATRPSPSCVVSRRLGTLASPHSHFGRHRKRKTILNRFSFTNPTSYARRHNPKDNSYRCASMQPKRKGSTMCYLFFLCCASQIDANLYFIYQVSLSVFGGS